MTETCSQLVLSHFINNSLDNTVLCFQELGSWCGLLSNFADYNKISQVELQHNKITRCKR